MELFERDVFLRALAEELAGAASGEGRTVLVCGEAGIGKTSLIERFVTDAGTRVLWGACEALSTPHPLGPLHDIARDARGALRGMLSQGAPRPALFSATLEELALAPGPTILVVEDAHWADAATLDLIRYLGRRIGRVPGLLLVSFRDDELDATHGLRATLGSLPSRHVRRLQLPRLSSGAVALLASRAKRDASGLYEATGGNPFFVTEALASAEGGVPATVRDAVLGRAAFLSEAAREVLEFAAIVPRAIDLDLLDAALQPRQEAVAECVTRGLLVAEDRGLRFRHELARVALESSIPLPRARDLHARALAALPATAPLASRVHHAQHACDGAAVLQLAPQAAREAALRGARREAAAHCRSALAFADLLARAEHAALLEDYSGHCFELNELAAAAQAQEAAIALLAGERDPARESVAHARHAVLLVRALRNREADRASVRALELARPIGPGRSLANAYATEAYLRMLNRDYRDAIAWGEKAAELARRLDMNDILAAAFKSMGAALLFVDYPRGCEVLHRSLEIARELPDGGAAVADAYVMLGTASAEVYELAAAQRFLEQGIAFARAQDLDRLADYMEAWQALVGVYQGRWDEAGEQANALLERDKYGSTNRLTALVALGRLRTRRGDPGSAAALEQALALAEGTGTLQRVAPVRAARAEAAWLAGDAALAAREARAGFGLALDKGHPWFLGELAYWLWRTGELPHPPAGCAAPFHAQIRGSWREAASLWRQIGCPYEQARALAEGDAAARREALRIADRLGAAPLAEHLRRAMRVAGEPHVPRGPRQATRSNPAGLTARELQVLELVARGWQNARIARQLCRSTRTVEHHLESILAKLEAGTRGEAVSLARDLGILSNMGGERRQSG